MLRIVVHLVLFLAMLLLQRVADAKDVHPPVGQSYYLAKTDILGEELIGGADVLILNGTKDCFVCNKSEIVDDSSTHFSDTESFYSSIAESYNLGAQLKRDFTLGVTLDATTRSISKTDRTIKGSTLNVLSKIGHCIVKPECIYDESYHTLSQHLLSVFEGLPRILTWDERGVLNFSAYDHFLNEFGSHIVTGVTYGSRMYQHCFSTSEQTYNERNYTVRACVAFSGGTEVTTTNISTCAGISKEEAEASTSLEVTTRLVIRGGTKETRAQLYAKRSSDLIAKFLSEASMEEPIEYSFTPIWTVLGQKYHGTEHYAKVRNLEAYYLGVLNFGCPYIPSSAPDAFMQFFADDSSSTEDVPSYNCYLGAEGCHVNDDCHYGPGIYCRCVGDSCFKYKTRTLNTGEQRKYVIANQEYWNYWSGCHLEFFSCDCTDNNPGNWLAIWQQDQDRADNGEMVRNLHYKAMLTRSRSAQLDTPPPQDTSSKEEL